MTRMRAIVLLALGCVGCVSFPHAGLLQGLARVEVVQGPVVCGPLGFRTVPLQSRWGEYVRVTVAAPGPLSGTVLVHANGVAQPPRPWTSESMVVEARFPNEDVDARFALERDRPIDITLTGLAGMCEGAVFTVEHGALVPSIDERAWIVELERRGGPELAELRAVKREAAQERRQAHDALWAARPQVQVSAELRQVHYAQWEARRNVSALPVAALSTEVVVSPGAAVVRVESDDSSSAQLVPSEGQPGELAHPRPTSPRFAGRDLMSLPSEWSQPFSPGFETVRVSSESQVATRVSDPSTALVVTAYEETSTELVIAPVVFEVLRHLVAAPGPVHGARPIR